VSIYSRQSEASESVFLTDEIGLLYALSQINRVIFSVPSQQSNQDKKIYLCQALELYALVVQKTFLSLTMDSIDDQNSG